MRSRQTHRVSCLAAGLLLVPGLAWATDINYVQPAALDQPRINAYLSFAPDGDPQTFEGTFNIQAYFDTGASGVLLSANTAAFLGVERSQFLNPLTGQLEDVAFHDVGVVGGDVFGVSGPVYFGLAPYHPDTDVDNPETFRNVYTHTFGPIRVQIAPPTDEEDPMSSVMGDLDVFGVPLMQGKVVVMDPRPVNSLLDTMRTYVYNPGTPFNPAKEDSDPGIPTTSRHVKLSYGDFERFTTTTPTGAPGPTMLANPFIGPNPVRRAEDPVDNTPGITVSYNGKSATGSWLLDTGAAASIMSELQAAELGVTYDPATRDTTSPTLLGVPLEDQFTLTIGGIGGTQKVAGFFLDSMLLRTEEGDAANDNDPNHFRFVRAPVLVSNISVPDPETGQTIVLDGIFGMNYLTANALIEEVEGSFPNFAAISGGAFSWVVYDQVNGRLGLELDTSAGQKKSLIWQSDLMDSWIPYPLSLFTGVTFMDERQQAQHYNDGDRVRFDDTSEVTEISLIVDVAPDLMVVDNSAKDYTFYSIENAAIIGPGSLIKRGTGTLRMEAPNTYRGLTEVAEGTMELAARQDIGPVYVHSGGKLVMETAQRFQSLHIVDGLAIMDPGKMVLIVDDLTVDGTGRLDLADNAAVIHAAQESRDEILAKISESVRSGRGTDANLWQGDGIMTSSAAQNRLKGLAVVLNDKGDGTPFRTEFMGEAVDINDIIIVYTWIGDLNLDEEINLNDYFIMDSNYLSQTATSEKTYQQGDLNYDGVINLSDYFLMDSAYLGQTQASGQQLVMAPEPGMLSLLAGAMLLLPRRRSRRA